MKVRKKRKINCSAGLLPSRARKDGAVASDAADPTFDAMTHGTLTVTVMDDGTAAIGVTVMYHDTDGTYLGSKNTDGNGQVVFTDFPTGGAVTARATPFPTTCRQTTASVTSKVQRSV